MAREGKQIGLEVEPRWRGPTAQCSRGLLGRKQGSGQARWLFAATVFFGPSGWGPGEAQGWWGEGKWLVTRRHTGRARLLVWGGCGQPSGSSRAAMGPLREAGLESVHGRGMDRADCKVRGVATGAGRRQSCRLRPAWANNQKTPRQNLAAIHHPGSQRGKGSRSARWETSTLRCQAPRPSGRTQHGPASAGRPCAGRRSRSPVRELLSHARPAWSVRARQAGRAAVNRNAPAARLVQGDSRRPQRRSRHRRPTVSICARRLTVQAGRL